MIRPKGPPVLAARLAACGLAALLSPWNAAPAWPNGPDGCLEQAAAWANVHPTLLRAIAWVESHGDHRALNWNRNGSYDVGLMQINSRWYYHGLKPWWQRLGQPCANVAAGAWVLRQCTEAYRYTWDAVGCYHAGHGWKRGRTRASGQRYIGRVQQALLRTPGGHSRNVRLSASPLRTDDHAASPVECAPRARDRCHFATRSHEGG